MHGKKWDKDNKMTLHDFHYGDIVHVDGLEYVFAGMVRSDNQDVGSG